MNIKSLYFLVFLFTLNPVISIAQQKLKQTPKIVKYKENVKAPLTAKELANLKEVYADKLNEYVLSKPNRLKDFKHLLRNRIQIQEMPKLIQHSEKFSLLSEAGLFNSYNKSLKADTSFNINTFNVLKYNLQFYNNGTKIYRIDNTNYFIIIKSQFQ